MAVMDYERTVMGENLDRQHPTQSGRWVFLLSRDNAKIIRLPGQIFCYKNSYFVLCPQNITIWETYGDDLAQIYQQISEEQQKMELEVEETLNDEIPF